ncbi:MAG: hypothetical protein ACK5Q5_01260 [Planctomycetaceae bacterium]
MSSKCKLLANRKHGWGLIGAEVLKLPRAETTVTTTGSKHDLRWRAGAALLIQLMVYSLL